VKKVRQPGDASYRKDNTEGDRREHIGVVGHGQRALPRQEKHASGPKKGVIPFHSYPNTAEDKHVRVVGKDVFASGCESSKHHLTERRRTVRDLRVIEKGPGRKVRKEPVVFCLNAPLLYAKMPKRNTRSITGWKNGKPAEIERDGTGDFKCAAMLR
jgi:hypothetical protein